MTSKQIKVLLLEDEPAHAEAIRRGLESADGAFKLQVVGSLKKYRERVTANPPDIVLLDMVLPDGNGIDLLAAPAEANAFPMLILTSHGNEQTAVNALKAGALDYIVKSPETFANMPRILTSALNQWSLIQENKKSRQALQTSENNFSNSIENSPLGIRIVSEHGETLYANKAFLDIYGYSSVEEFKTTPVKDRYTSESYVDFHDRREKRRSREPLPDNYEVSVIRKDGMVRHLQVVRKQILWGGQPQYQTIYQDITERKQAEEKVRQSEEKYSTLVEKSNDGIVIIENGIVQFINTKLTTMTGFTNDEVLGRKFIDFSPPEERELLMERHMKRMSGEKVTELYETKLVARDGHHIPVEINAINSVYQGHPVVLAFIRDETDRKRAEEALRKSEQKYRTLFEKANEGILIADIKTRKFKYANPAIGKMLGYSQEELMAMSVMDIHPKNSLEHVLAEFDAKRRGKNVLASGLPCLKKDGTIIYTNINITRNIIDGKKYNVGFFTDITERKQAEEALKNSEERLRTTVRYAPVGISTSGPDRKFISANETFCRILGYTEGELQRLTFKDITHPEDMGESARQMQALDAGKVTSFSQEKRYIKKDGEVITGKVVVSLLRDQTSNPRMYIAELEDITTRKRAEEAIRESEEKFKYVFNNSAIGKSLTAISGEIHVNKAFCEMVGYSEEELAHKSWQEITHPDDVELTQKAVDSLITGNEKTVRFIKRYIHKNGSDVWTDVQSSLRRDENGKPLYLITSIMDITERRQMEIALQASEEKYRTLIEYANEAILVSQDGRLKYVNQMTFRLFPGYSEKEFINTPVTNFIHPEDYTRLIKDYRKQINNEPVLQGNEYRIIMKEGSIKWAEIGTALIEWENGPAILYFITDVTERKRAAEALQASEEKYRLIVENSNDIIFTFSATGEFVYISPSVKKALGYNPADIIGKPFISFVHPEDVQGLQQAIQRNIKDGSQTPGGNEFRLCNTSGEWRWHNASGNAVFDATGKYLNFVGISKDITERKQMTTRINELNNILQLVSDINQLIVETDNEADLLEKACHRFVESRQYRLAWIGFKKKGSFDVVPTIWCGQGADYLSLVKITWDNSPLGQGPTGTTIKTGKPSVMRDILNEPKFEPWKAEARKRGFQSSAALPLIIQDKVMGALTVYSTSADAFNENELRLLSELAGDLSLGIEKIRRREEISKTQEALKASEQNFRNSLDNSFMGIRIGDTGEQTLYVNQAFLDIFGYGNTKEVSTSPPTEHYPPASYADSVLRKEKIARGETIPDKVEVDIVRKDGAIRHLQIYRKEIFWNGKQESQVIYDDITERAQAEEALRDSERKLREAQEIAHLGFWQWDTKTGNVKWSDEVFKIFRLDPKGFTPQIDSILALSPWPEDHQRDQELIKRATESHVPGSYEQKFLRSDKSIGYYYSNFQGEYDDSGNLVSIIGTILDITQRKITEEALKASEQNFRNSMDSSIMGTYIVNVDRHILYVNQAFLDIFGYKNIEEASSSPPHEHYTPQEYANFLLRREKELRGEPITGEGEADIIHKDGSIRHLHVFRREILWDGKPQLQIIYHDITERKQAEEALKASEENFRNSISTSPLGIRVRDKDGHILFSNQAFLDMFGYKNIEEVKIHPPPEYYTPASYADYLVRKNKRQHGESLPDAMEIDIKRNDGTMRHLQVLRREVLWDGKQEYQILYNDITERKRAEEALKVSEQNFRNSLDNSFIGTYIVDTDENIPYANQAFLDMFGYENIEEVKASPPTKHYTPESYADFLLRMEKELHGEPIPTQEEVDVIRKDGTSRHLQVFRREVIWDGKHQHQVLFVDITERKRIEDELKASEQNFRNTLDVSSMGIRIIDADFHILYANQAFLNVFGYKNIEEAKVSPPREHYTPESYAEYLTRHATILHGEPTPEKLEIDIVRPDDTTRHVQAFYKEVFWDGKIQYQTLYNDITERKQIEDALRASEQNFRNSLDAFLIGIRITTVDSYTLYANQTFLDMFGYENIEEARNSPPQEHYTPESYTDYLQRKEQFAGGESIPDAVDIDVIRKDGSIRHLHVFNNKVRWNGKDEFQGLYQDITELKQAEEEKRRLEEKAEIASRLAAVGGMAAGIAHEINNPLTGVLGFSQMLLERENVPEDIRENLTLIADGSQRVADIVKRLLTFARQAKPVKAMANLNELISNTLKLREYVMKTSNIEVITKFDQQLPLSLVDPGQLQQVFLNLIVNAEQAIKGGSGRGTLTITTEKKKNNIRMSFQDDGPGISKENIGRLFDPFFTTKAPGEGTGLGLSLSRSIILEHNGSMSVESEPGHGATFIIELPVIRSFLSETEALSPVAKEMPAAMKKGRILAVDDEPGVRTLLEKVLTQNGHTVDTIGDASQALDKLQAGAVYDVILTDVRMPGMSGIELYSRILEKMPAMKDRIIFVTGDVMGADIKEFLTQNNLPYLAKPFNIKLLKETIENTLMTSHRENDKPDGVTNENAE